MNFPALIPPFLIGYLLGSIPFAFILVKLAGLGDIRSVGSGNVGTTNVLRTGKKWLAALTLLLDVGKGFLAVWLCWWFIGKAIDFAATQNPAAASGVSPAMLMSFAIAGGYGAFIGHVYPIWLNFSGGKGVATFIGVLFGLDWPLGLAFCLIWLAVAFTFRYSSLAALVASVSAPLVAAGLGQTMLAAALVPLTALLIYKHHANISRLMNGEEPKIGAR